MDITQMLKGLPYIPPDLAVSKIIPTDDALRYTKAKIDAGTHTNRQGVSPPADLNIDITLRDNVTGDYVKVPIIPEAIYYQNGETQAVSVNILNLGTVNFPSGTDLDTVNWGSFFAANYDPGYCKYSDQQTPVYYRDKFTEWKKGLTSLQLIIPVIDINLEVYVNTFNWELSGAAGDITYQVALKEYRHIKPKQIATSETTLSTTKNPENRPELVNKVAIDKYTVQTGDTLTRISKITGVNPWQTIYSKNKSTIGPDPDKIYPGQVFNIS
jgi:hypothetical protein